MKQALEYARNALTQVMAATEGERMLIIYDDVKETIAQVLIQASLQASLYTRTIRMMTQVHEYRTTVPPVVHQALSQAPPHLAINLLRGPAEETPFRIKLITLETQHKRIRLGHGPGITSDMLSMGALALSVADYEDMNRHADKLITATTGAQQLHVTTPQGTDAVLSIQDRAFFKDTVITNEKWGNLPTGEVTVGPREDSLTGQIVCDLAIGGIGRLQEHIALHCKHGRVTDLQGSGQVLKKVQQALAVDAMASVVGEMAIGLNPKARLTDEFLEAEKVYGTAHIAFGRNIDYPTGGENASANHMDFLMSNPTVTALFPNKQVDLVRDGQILL